MRVGNVATLRDVAEACNTSVKSVSLWASKEDFPKDEDGTYPLFQIGLWRQRNLDDRAPKQKPPPSDEDPLLNAGDSVGLERYRMAKAQLAEMDLAEREKSMLSADAVHDGLSIISQAYRKACEILQRKFGSEAFSILEEAQKEAEAQINDMFRVEEDDSPGSTEGDEG
jgi:hypothetical protein